MSLDAEPIKYDDSLWDYLVEDIVNEKCVLFIGPESVLKAPGQLYHSELVKSEKLQGNRNFEYIEKDQMFLLRKESDRSMLVSAFRGYCRTNNYYEETYKKIAAIPFPAVIVATRYPFIINTFEKANIPFQHRWFSKKFDNSSPLSEMEVPGGKTPLVYNLFGNPQIETPEGRKPSIGNLFKDDSLFLTHKDMFDYLKKMLNTDIGFPPILKEFIQSSNQIIFLGFKFESWFVQLLLRIFELSPGKSFKLSALNSHEQDDIMRICETDFQMTFIDDDIEPFINKLYDKCVQAKVEFRQASIVNNDDGFNEFDKLVADNLFPQALKKLEELVIKNNLNNESIIQLKGDYNMLMEEKDTLRSDDYDLRIRVLRKKLIERYRDILGQVA